MPDYRYTLKVIAEVDHKNKTLLKTNADEVIAQMEEDLQALKARNAEEQPGVETVRNPDDTPRRMTPAERRDVQRAIDEIAKDGKYAAFAPLLQRMLDADQILVCRMGENDRGRTLKTGECPIVLNLDMFGLGDGTLAGNPVLLGVLAGTLAHEYGHRVVFLARDPILGLRLGVVVDAVGRLYAFGVGLGIVADALGGRPIKKAGRDQYGAQHNASEIGHWRLGIDVERRVTERLQKEFRQRHEAKRRKGSQKTPSRSQHE